MTSLLPPTSSGLRKRSATSSRSHRGVHSLSFRVSPAPISLITSGDIHGKAAMGEAKSFSVRIRKEPRARVVAAGPGGAVWIAFDLEQEPSSQWSEKLCSV